MRRYVVGVLAFAGVEPRVSIVGHLPHTVNGDVARQDRVKVVGVGRGRGVEVGDVVRCVYAGIRPPRTCNLDSRAQQSAQRILQRTLYRRRIGLPLPAAICRAQV